MQEFSLEKNLIAFYRDMVEGGKPQFLIYVKVNTSLASIRENFKKDVKKTCLKSSIKENKMAIDGKKLIGIKRDKIDQLYITPDTIVCKKKAYKVMPSAAAAIVMLIQHLRD